VVSPPSRRLGWGRVAESSLWLGLVVVVLVVVVRLVGCCLVGACGSAAALFLLLSAWPKPTHQVHAVTHISLCKHSEV
jgi:hypothetical protein